MPSSSTFLALIFLTLTITITTTSAAGKEFQVGDDVGWRVPASNETELYNVWASRRHFHIGDSLRFQYKNDSVVMTVKFAFRNCDARQPISVSDDGNTVINLDRVGKFYFISGKADRCNKGEKMIVNVRSMPHSIATPPNNPSYAMSPAPAQFSGSGSSSDSAPAVAVLASVVSFVVAVAVIGLVNSG